MEYKEEILLKEYLPNAINTQNMCEFFYAFSDGTRLKIVMLLMMKPLCVGEVSNILNVNQTTISHQLKILKSLNIVSGIRSGKNITYYIKNTSIEGVFNAMLDCI